MSRPTLEAANDTSKPRPAVDLPFEIWADIFEIHFQRCQIYSTGPGSSTSWNLNVLDRCSLFKRSMTAHYDLREVCRAWNDIVLSRAALWTTISLYMDKGREYMTPDTAQIVIPRHLRLSKGYPLHVSVWAHDSADPNPFGKLLRVLFRHASRFTSLELMNIDNTWYTNSITDLCRLELFSLCSDHVGSSFTNDAKFLAALQNAPLHHVRLANPYSIQSMRDNIAWSRVRFLACNTSEVLLRYLTATGASGIEVVELVKLTRTDFLTSPRWEHAPVTQPGLKSLRVNGNDMNWEFLFANLMPPSLEHFSIYFRFYVHPALADRIGPLLSERYTSITTLSLHCIGDVAHSKIGLLLESLSGLRQLEIFDLKLPFRPTLLQHLLYLSGPPHAGLRNVFIRLQTIIYEHVEHLPDHLANATDVGPNAIPSLEQHESLRALLPSIDELVKRWNTVVMTDAGGASLRTFILRGINAQVAQYPWFLEHKQKWAENGRLVVVEVLESASCSDEERGGRERYYNDADDEEYEEGATISC